MDCSTPGFTALHCLLEFAHTHVHWFGDAIWPSHPLLPSSPLAFNHSQHQGLFQWVSSSCQAAKALDLQLQHQSFQWIFRVDFLPDWLVGSCCLKDSQESSPAPQFERTILWHFVFFMSSSHIHTWLLETARFWLYGLLLAKWCFWFRMCCLVLS